MKLAPAALAPSARFGKGLSAGAAAGNACVVGGPAGCFAATAGAPEYERQGGGAAGGGGGGLGRATGITCLDLRASSRSLPGGSTDSNGLNSSSPSDIGPAGFCVTARLIAWPLEPYMTLIAATTPQSATMAAAASTMRACHCDSPKLPAEDGAGVDDNASEETIEVIAVQDVVDENGAFVDELVAFGNGAGFKTMKDTSLTRSVPVTDGFPLPSTLIVEPRIIPLKFADLRKVLTLATLTFAARRTTPEIKVPLARLTEPKSPFRSITAVMKPLDDITMMPA